MARKLTAAEGGGASKSSSKQPISGVKRAATLLKNEGQTTAAKER